MPLLAPAPPVSPPVVLRAFAPAPEAWLPAHRGVDLLASPGQAVVAVRTGTVVFSGVVAGRPVLTLRSRGVRFTFEPVVAARPVGTRVRTGDALGRIGTGGHCGGACLHWGAKVAGAYVDPMSFLPRQSPVLKPLAG